MKKFVLIALILIFARNVLLAQPGVSVQGGLQSGKILGHKEDKNRSIWGFTLDVNRQVSGSKYWHHDHKFPQMGLQLSGRKFLSNESLNFTFSLIPYLEFNLLKSVSGIFQVKHGTGLAYVTGDFSNPVQSYVGSRINAATMLDLGYQFNTGLRVKVKAGTSLSHISNGNLVWPNAGINTFTPYVQLIFYPVGTLPPVKVQESVTEFRKWHYRILAATGFYDYKKEEKTLNTNNQASMLVFYQHTTRFRTGLGAEASSLFKNKWRPSLYAEEEVLIGHLVTRYGVGCYVTAPESGEGKLYEKVGIAWYPFPLNEHIPEKWSVGMAIKAHGFRAAHIEISTGYMF